jgi:methyl-accepting chemotaxis protein
MTVGWRIALAFGVILFGGGVLSAFVYKTTDRLIADNAWVVHTRAVIELLETVPRSANRAEASVLSFVITGDEAQRRVFNDTRVQAAKAISGLAERTRDNPMQQARVLELKTQVDQVFEALQRLASQQQGMGGHDVSASVSASGYQVALEDVRRIVEAMKDAEQELLRQRADSAQAAANTCLRAVVWGGIAIVGACLAIGLMLTLSILRPVHRLLHGAAEIGTGNLQYRTSTGTTDELGALATSFNDMAENLSRTMVTADTERDARARIEGLLTAMSETAAHLVSSTAEIVAATNQQAAGAHEQVVAVTQTVASVDEVVQSSQQARERAQNVAESARLSAAHGETGRRVVAESLAAMQQVSELVEHSARSTSELARTADAIGGLILSVADIAEQTNVLALNAAIEATRAGVHGATFRVVASEVRKLSGQTKSAAEQVRKMIQDVQTATGTLVSNSAACSQSVVAASKVIARADESISALARIIDTASESAAQIAASASQQETGTVQIHHAMKQIRDVTVQSLSSTRQMEQAANDLNTLGVRLRAHLVAVDSTAA